MKKIISALVLLALVLSTFSHFDVKAQEDSLTAVDSQDRIEAIPKLELTSKELEENKHAINSSATELRQASEETLILAEKVVQELVDGAAFTLGIECTLNHMYNTAKWVAPDVVVLETKEDSSLALLQIYEETLIELKKYDLDRYNAFWEKALYSAVDSPVEIDDFIRHGQKLFSIRRIIEALLALDCYYVRLNENEIQHMTSVFKEFSNTSNASAIKIYGETDALTLFEHYRAKQDSNSFVQGSRSISMELNGVTYVDSSTVNTTGGKVVSTFYAQNQLSSAQISAFYSDFYGQSGYSDLSYVSTATSYYNCHAYAWHSTTPGRKWIDTTFTVNGTTYYGVEQFINDDHCTLLGSSDNVAQVNDIIVYYVNGVAAHSGIVVSTNPLRIKSKWGQGCVWIHNKTSVPPEYKNFGTVNVKFYRYTRTHTYQDIDYGDDVYHKHQCTICAYYELEKHKWVEYHINPTKVENDMRYILEYYCSKCGAFTLKPIE